MRNLTPLTYGTLTFVALASCSVLGAPIVGNINTATITHDPGFGNPVVTGPGPMGLSYTLTQIAGGPGGAQSSGAGSVVPITAQNIFGLQFPEMLISQSGNDPGIHEATLKFDLDISFIMDANGFGPNPFEYYRFDLAGNSGGPGDYVKFDLNMDAFASGQPYGPGWHDSFTLAGQGAFATTRSGSSGFLRPLLPNEVVEMKGTLVLTASDPYMPVFIHAIGHFNVPELSHTGTLLLLGFGALALCRARVFASAQPTE